MMSYKKIYERLKEKLTDEEIAEAFMIPEDLTEEEEKKAHEEIAAFRFKLLKERTEQDRLLSDLMKLRILMKEYVEKEPYSEGNDFGDYLSEYIRILKKTKRKVAEDLSIHYTRLSRIVNNKEEPNIEFIYRLEKHSGQLIPSVLWWRLLVKKQEHQIKEDEQTKQEEAAKVKNALKFRA